MTVFGPDGYQGATGATGPINRPTVNKTSINMPTNPASTTSLAGTRGHIYIQPSDSSSTTGLHICFGVCRPSSSQTHSFASNSTTVSFSARPIVCATLAMSSDSQVQRCSISAVTTSGFTMASVNTGQTVSYIAVGRGNG